MNRPVRILLVLVVSAFISDCAGAFEESINPEKPTFFVGWGTLALVNAGLAQIKNKLNEEKDLGGLAWFFLSLLLGPIATFFIVVFKDAKTVKAAALKEDDE